MISNLMTRGLRCVLLSVSAVLSSASAQTVAYVTAPAPNSSSTFSASAGYTNSFGLVFTAGPSGPYSLDWVKLGLFSNTLGAGSANFTVELRNATSTVPGSGSAGSTAFATDAVTFSLPGTTYTFFDLSLTSAQLPNITGYSLQSNATYSLIIYNSSSTALAMARATYASAAYSHYSTSNGFTVLDSLRLNYDYGTNAYSISLGEVSAVPEPSTYAAIVGGAVFGVVGWLRRRHRKASPFA